MKPAIRRAAWVVAALAVVTAIVAFALWPRPVLVDIASVTRGPMRVTVDATGRTRVVDFYVVSAPVSGRLLRNDLEVGDRVKGGESIVARILPSAPGLLDRRSLEEAEAAVKAAEAAQRLVRAEVRRAEAELAYARADFARAQALAERGTLAQAELDRKRLALQVREAALNQAKSTLDMREFDLERARARLIQPGDNGGDKGPVCCVEVRAPSDGMVLKILQKNESDITAGTPIIEIGDPSALELVVDLLSEDAVRVSPGARVEIVDWGGDTALAGHVVRVEPYGHRKVSALGIEEQRVDVIVAIDTPVEERPRLGHGYRAEARIVVWDDPQVLQVPVGALFRVAGGWGVFAVEDGVAMVRAITIGHRNANSAEVLTGLDEGARVVLYPSERVRGGVRVAPRSRVSSAAQ